MPLTEPTAYWAEHAWVDTAVQPGVLIAVSADGHVTGLTPGVPHPPANATVLRGLTLPGLANTHSHAFHRALRAAAWGGGGPAGDTANTTPPANRTATSETPDTSDRGAAPGGGDDTGPRTGGHDGPATVPDSFWTWREVMYAVAERLTPDLYFDLARAVYAEMALTGITAVGEFHYLHHAPGGTAYRDPNAMGLALVAAAREAGVRLTLLDTCYLSAGFGNPPGPVQRRFSDGTAAAWADRVSDLGPDATTRVGAAIHSVRAVPAEELATVAGWAQDRGVPLHLHLSEQPAENDECHAAHGRTPTRLLADHGVLGPGTTAVHATHLTAADIALLGGSGTGVCLCPSTERDLADGVPPTPELRAAGAPLSLGSDSHATVDLLAEARSVELDQRPRTRRRGHFSTAELLDAATRNGHAALGWPDAGRLAPGALADLTTVALDTVRTAGQPARLAAETVVAAGTAADIRHTVVAGRHIVRDGVHQSLPDVPGALTRALAALRG